jgi:hypothetical protein
MRWLYVALIIHCVGCNVAESANTLGFRCLGIPPRDIVEKWKGQAVHIHHGWRHCQPEFNCVRPEAYGSGLASQPNEFHPLLILKKKKVIFETDKVGAYLHKVHMAATIPYFQILLYYFWPFKFHYFIFWNTCRVVYFHRHSIYTVK